MKTISELYQEHVDELYHRAQRGDIGAAKNLAALALLCEGWRPGDDDPEGDGGPDDDGGERETIADAYVCVTRLAA